MEVDGDFAKFQSISVDGAVIGKENYEAKSGSTIITFAESYLNSLSTGKHAVVVNFTDGAAATSLIVKEKEAVTSTTKPMDTSKSNQTSSPATGDNNNSALWFALILASAGVITNRFISRRSKTPSSFKSGRVIP